MTSPTAPKTGGPAFPSVLYSHERAENWSTDGMTLRDYFAAQALPTVLGLVGIPEDGPDDLWDGSIAERCFAISDAMISERAKAEGRAP